MKRIKTMDRSTETVEVFVDEITEMGSAFGATSEGEAVFINKRIVNAVGLAHGDRLRAAVLPNYEDKRDGVPWRALKAEVIGTIFEDISHEPTPEPEVAPEPEPEPQETLSDRIVDLLSEGGPMRSATMAKYLDVDSADISSMCRGLNKMGKVAAAEIYGDLNNSRPSHIVWAFDINDFDSDE
tara:strand:+ start:824 stop:1372 length:549 start_codon:yes stop_codon:yes gene_type:complete